MSFLVTVPKPDVLEKWQAILSGKQIMFEKIAGLNASLVAYVEKIDEEGHHWMKLIIYDYGNGMDVWTDLLGTMISMYGIEPNKAIDRFLIEKVAHFS